MHTIRCLIIRADIERVMEVKRCVGFFVFSHTLTIQLTFGPLVQAGNGSIVVKCGSKYPKTCINRGKEYRTLRPLRLQLLLYAFEMTYKSTSLVFFSF